MTPGLPGVEMRGGSSFLRAPCAVNFALDFALALLTLLLAVIVNLLPSHVLQR